jgi:hypothetical protein
MMLNTYDLVQQFRSLFLRGNPASYARMNKPNAYSKYTKMLDPRSRAPLVITDGAIAKHLSGTATYAAPLIGADGFTREAALDIDHGGEVAIQCALHIAREFGYYAYAIAGTPVVGGHDGGHIRIPLADVAAPERARLLAQQIQQCVITRLSLPENVIELYPTQKGLRLPLGIHIYTGRRGVLLLQDGTRLNLDDGKPFATIAQALNLIEALPANNPETLPTPAPVSPPPASLSNSTSRGSGNSPIQDYNHHTNLLDWLISIGGRVAAQTRSGGYLLHCPCNNHKHHDASPSLEVQPARNVSRFGAYVIIGHSTGCMFASQPGRIVDSFDAYCRWHGLSIKEALNQLYPR